METITLTIPAMKSSHCQLTVANTVKNLGASVMASTQVTLELSNGLTKENVIQAIEKTGYAVADTKF